MPVLSHTFLRDYLAQHLQRVNVTQEIAAVVANNLVDASLKGHDSHGVTLLPRYIEAIRVGELDPTAPLELTRDEGALLSFHGNRGFGQVQGRNAMIHGIERARRFGVSVVGSTRSVGNNSKCWRMPIPRRFRISNYLSPRSLGDTACVGFLAFF